MGQGRGSLTPQYLMASKEVPVSSSMGTMVSLKSSPTMETALAVSGVVDNLLPLPLAVEDRAKIISLAIETCMDFDRFQGGPWSSSELLNNLRRTRAKLPVGSTEWKRMSSYIMAKSEVA